jgi:hypothetical protein
MEAIRDPTGIAVDRVEVTGDHVQIVRLSEKL